jgi:hypothetical protein
MQKIQKFQFGRLYAAPKSTKTYELINRDGHALTFRVRNPKTRDSWKQLATSTYKADQTGAFEEVLFSDGARLRSDTWCSEPKKVRRMSADAQQGIVELMAALAA